VLGAKKRGGGGVVGGGVGRWGNVWEPKNQTYQLRSRQSSPQVWMPYPKAPGTKQWERGGRMYGVQRPEGNWELGDLVTGAPTMFKPLHAAKVKENCGIMEFLGG